MTRRQRIAIIGVSGMGKTTLAERLSTTLDLPFIQLDALVHLPGWKEASDEELRRQVKERLDGSLEGWIVDGNYEAKLGPELRNHIYESADAVVWLDLPLRVMVYRLVSRVLKDIYTKRDLYNGNTQSWRFAFFERDSLVVFAIKQHFIRRRAYPAKFAAMKNVNLVRLRSPRDVEDWLRRTIEIAHAAK